MEILGLTTGTGEIISCLLACLASLLLFVSYPMLVIWKLSCRIYTKRKFYPYPFMSFLWYSASLFVYITSVYIPTGFPPPTLSLHCIGLSVWVAFIMTALCIFLLCALFGGTTQKSIAYDIFVTSVFIVHPAFIILLFMTFHVDGMFYYDGPIAAFFGILMYASPLPIIMDTGKDGVSDYHPSWLCSTLLLNSFAWTLFYFNFNVPNFDRNFTVTHVIGTILALSQLVFIHGFFKLSMMVISGVMKFSRCVSSVLHWAGYSCLAAVIIFHSYVLLIRPMMMSQA